MDDNRTECKEFDRMANPVEVIDATPDVAHNEPATTKLLGGITGKGFMPGQSGNPTGRKKKPLTEALEQVFTPAECLAAAKALAQRARKGSIAHFQEAANRLRAAYQIQTNPAATSRST